MNLYDLLTKERLDQETAKKVLNTENLVPIREYLQKLDKVMDFYDYGFDENTLDGNYTMGEFFIEVANFLSTMVRMVKTFDPGAYKRMRLPNPDDIVESKFTPEEMESLDAKLAYYVETGRNFHRNFQPSMDSFMPLY